MLQPSTHDLPTVLDLLDGAAPVCPDCHHRGGPTVGQPADYFPLAHGAGCELLGEEVLLALADHMAADGRPWLRRPLAPAEAAALVALGWQPEPDGVVLVVFGRGQRRRIANLADGQPAPQVMW